MVEISTTRKSLKNMDFKTKKRFECYECEEDECNLPAEESSVCENAIYCWKSSVREEDGTERNARGCLSSFQQVRFTCSKKVHKNKGSQYHIECCEKEFCNNGTFPLLQNPDTPPESDQAMSTMKLTMAVVLPLLALVFIIVAIFVYYRRNKKDQLSHSIKYYDESPDENSQMMDMENEAKEAPQPGSSDVGAVCSYSSPDLKVTSAGDNTLKAYLDGQSLTSGSGSGLPLLMQRTLSKQISLVEHLNKGRFGQQHEVWRGIWQGESVAVKIYSSRSEMLWARETEVFTQLLPSKHDNILGYLGSDTTSAASCTQLWLVTHYHPNGSLRNYLREKELEHNEMLKVCLSLTYGLLYLHTEIHGTQGKVSMAHRNLHSKNVFVKSDGSCVISDFGHAVTQERLDDIDFLEHISKRYASPELLERTFESGSLESFRQADIYSLSLIFWESCRRCISTKGVALDYAIPYDEWLASDNKEPTLEEMRKLVVEDQCRPSIPEHWEADQTLAGMGAMIKECWPMKAAARLPILRVKKTLLKLASVNPDVDLPLDDF